MSGTKIVPITSLAEALTQAVVGALSDMAFLDAVTTGPVDPPFATSHVIATGFSLPVRGKIVLYLSLDSKKAVVENVHGSEWESLTAAQIDDCLLELGNVVAGNFLSAYCGKGTAHDVSLPQLLFDDTQTECGGECVTLSFDAEGHSLKATASLE